MVSGTQVLGSFITCSGVCTVKGEVSEMSICSDPGQQQTDVTHVQQHSGRPWYRLWNWVLDKPNSAGVPARWVIAAGLLFNGLLSVLRLTPALEPQTEAPGVMLNGLGIELIPLGAAWAWSAVRLHRSLRTDA